MKNADKSRQIKIERAGERERKKERGSE